MLQTAFNLARNLVITLVVIGWGLWAATSTYLEDHRPHAADLIHPNKVKGFSSLFYLSDVEYARFDGLTVALVVVNTLVILAGLLHRLASYREETGTGLGS